MIANLGVKCGMFLSNLNTKQLIAAKYLSAMWRKIQGRIQTISIVIEISFIKINRGRHGKLIVLWKLSMDNTRRK